MIVSNTNLNSTHIVFDMSSIALSIIIISLDIFMYHLGCDGCLVVSNFYYVVCGVWRASSNDIDLALSECDLVSTCHWCVRTMGHTGLSGSTGGRPGTAVVSIRPRALLPSLRRGWQRAVLVRLYLIRAHCRITFEFIQCQRKCHIGISCSVLVSWVVWEVGVYEARMLAPPFPWVPFWPSGIISPHPRVSFLLNLGYHLILGYHLSWTSGTGQSLIVS